MGTIEEYRLTYPSKADIKADLEDRAKHPFIEWLKNDRPRGFVTAPLPPDRVGLLAAMHDRCCVTDDQVKRFNETAESIAKQIGRRIYIVFTTGRWHLILLSIPDPSADRDDALWYDDHEVWNGKRQYAADQFIGHYDPDGSFHLDGVS